MPIYSFSILTLCHSHLWILQKWKKYGAAKGLPDGPSPATTSLGEDVFLELRSSGKQEVCVHLCMYVH